MPKGASGTRANKTSTAWKRPSAASKKTPAARRSKTAVKKTAAHARVRKAPASKARKTTRASKAATPKTRKTTRVRKSAVGARKPTAEAIAKRNRVKQLEFLAKSSQLLNSTLNYDRLLGLIMKVVKDALDVETVSVIFYDRDKRNLVFELARGKHGREIVGLKVPAGTGIVGWVAKNKKPIIVNDVVRDKRFKPTLGKKLGIKARSIMSIPLKRGSRFIGVLEAVNRRKNLPFTDDDLDVFLALGNHIAAAIENARLYREAERKQLESALLYKVSATLGRSLALDDVLEEILKSLKRLICYDAAAIFVLDRKSQMLISEIHHGYDPAKEKRLLLKLDEGVVGWAARNKKGVVVPDCSKDPRYVNARKRTGSELVAPMLSRGKVIGLFNLESDAKDAYREKDLRLLNMFAAQAAVSIERASLYEEQRIKREIERELKLARTVQRYFTPTHTRTIGSYKLAGRNYPSLELSGDYFDFFPLEAPFAAFAIADVAGKGVPASIIMSSFRAILHTAAPYYTSARDIALRANEILLESVRRHEFVTAFIGVLNSSTGEVVYCNAGHNPPIVMRAGGEYEMLETGGPVLGVFEDIPLEEGSVMLGDGLLFCYTDGTIDAINRDEEPFEIESLVEFLKSHPRLGPSRICTALRRKLKAHTQGMPQVDDITFLAVKKKR
ncbi:MAG: SpoIIE family protein phosphatase [Candidatus Latescibacterota bacterium]|nr:MAG: SpoIIE family protein phosphatase [Candidatus Latescibacterota bacterium]